MGRGPYGRHYFLDERELQWASPGMHFPLPQARIRALKDPKAVLSSTDTSIWRRHHNKISVPYGSVDPIAPHWRIMFETDYEFPYIYYEMSHHREGER